MNEDKKYKIIQTIAGSSPALVGDLNTTERRLQAVKQMLRWEIGFEIHNIGKFKYYVDDYTPRWYQHYSDPPELVTFPFSRCLDGSGVGGSYTPLPDAAKKILKLIRDNHDIFIQELWDMAQQLSPEKRKGYKMVLSFPETTELIEKQEGLYRGTIFTDCPDREAVEAVNREMKKHRQDAITVYDRVVATILRKLPEYRECRRVAGQWDEDEDLSLEPRVESGRDVYIKDIFAVLEKDDEKRLENYLHLPYYRSFFFDREVPVYDGDDYGHTRRDISALIYCSYHNAHKCMKSILEHKADPNYQNKGGSSALHIAGRYGYTECVKLLMAHGIDVTLKEKGGRTAWARCMERDETQCAALIK